MEHGDRILARESEHYGGHALQTGVEKPGERRSITRWSISWCGVGGDGLLPGGGGDLHSPFDAGECEGPALTTEEGEDRERKKTQKDGEDVIRKQIGTTPEFSTIISSLVLSHIEHARLVGFI